MRHKFSKDKHQTIVKILNNGYTVLALFIISVLLAFILPLENMKPPYHFSDIFLILIDFIIYALFWILLIKKYFKKHPILISIGLFILVILPLAYSFSSLADTDQTAKNIYLFVFTGISLVIVLAVIGSLTKCPKCHKMFAKKDAGSEDLDQRTGYRTRHITSEIHNNKGELERTITTPTRVQVTVQKYRQHYVCRRCGYRWAIDKETTID